MPKKLRKFAVDPYVLQYQNSFLGFSSARTHTNAYNYLLGTAGGQAIINPEETLVAIRRVLHILKKVTFRGGRTLFVSTQPTLARLCRVVGEQSGQYLRPYVTNSIRYPCSSRKANYSSRCSTCTCALHADFD